MEPNKPTCATKLREKPPQRTISHPMVTLGGWSNDASQCITTALSIGNGPAHSERAGQVVGAPPIAVPPTGIPPGIENIRRVDQIIGNQQKIIEKQLELLSSMEETTKSFQS